ncbi:MAG: metal-dependent hydrolase, partial [Gemmatimonas sp.]
MRPAVSADTLVFGDTLLVHLPPPRPGSPAPTMRAGDTVRIRLGLATARGPVRITDAVGGRPIVLADSTITRDVDTEGNAGFRNLNPRSAIGVNRARTRAWLAVTAATEHLTAILAEHLLTHPQQLEGAEPRLRDLWLWHSSEES